MTLQRPVMRSTSGANYIALDHVRAVAAFLVIAWHFMHGANGYPLPFEGAPRIFPLALFDEGHTGVALFMCLSGYLFCKLLSGYKINYRLFMLNRALRLLPLLLLVISIVFFIKYIEGIDPYHYGWAMLKGIYLPTLPNGGWSITVEFHFYIFIPVFLWAIYSGRYLVSLFLIIPFLLRVFIWFYYGDIQKYSYFTIIGRFDQFFLGMLAYRYRALIVGRHAVMATLTVSFLVFYWYFDKLGGFYLFPNYPSNHFLWVIMPFCEGLFYATLIAWYDQSFSHSNGFFSKLVARFGEYSYSFYLLHFFFVFHTAAWIDQNIINLSNFYIALFFSFVFYIAMFPLGYLSYRFIESPFLRFRRKYIIK